MGRAGASRRVGMAVAALAALGAAAMTPGAPHAMRKAIAPMRAVAAEAETLALSGNRAPLELGARPLRVTLSPPAGESLRARLRALAPDREIYVMLQELQVAAATLVGFDVYFELPETAAADPRDPHHIGNFNFFDAESGRRNAVFNITALARALAADGALGERASVTIVPTGAPEENARPTIGRAAMIAVAR